MTTLNLKLIPRWYIFSCRLRFYQHVMLAMNLIRNTDIVDTLYCIWVMVQELSYEILFFKGCNLIPLPYLQQSRVDWNKVSLNWVQMGADTIPIQQNTRIHINSGWLLKETKNITKVWSIHRWFCLLMK